MQKILKGWLKPGFVVLASLVLGLFLRLYNLTSLPVFADEAIYIRWSQIMQAEPTLRFLPLSDGKQPFFMWVLMLFVDKVSDPLFAGRLVSVFSGATTLIGVFAVTYLLFRSKLAASVSALIWAICPYALFFDRMALVDSILAMFSIWSCFFIVLFVKTLRLDFAMIAGFFLGGAMLTKSPALFILLLTPSVWVLIRRLDRVNCLKVVALSLISLSISIGMYNVLRLGPNFHLISTRNLDYVYPLDHLFRDWRDPLVSHLGMVWDWLVKLGPWSLVLLVVTGVILNFKKYTKELLVVGLWFTVPILIQAEYAQVFAARYIFFSLPFLVVLASVAFVWDTKTYSSIKKVVVIGLVIFSFKAIEFDRVLLTNPSLANLPESEKNGYFEEWTSGIGLKEVSDYIKLQKNSDPTGQIIVGTEGYFGTLPDGLQIYLTNTPRVTVIGVGLDLKEIPSPLVDSVMAGNRTYLVINKSRLLMDLTDPGLDLIAVYPKLPRVPGTWHYNIKGEQEVLFLFQVQNVDLSQKI